MPPLPRKNRPRPSSRSTGHPPTEEPLHGINPVEAALQAERRSLTELVLKAEPSSEALARLRWLAGQRHVPVSEASPAELERLCGTRSHQGAVLRCGPLPLEAEAAALAIPPQQPAGEPTLLIALDEVEDPRNFGAVVRCCASLGAHGVVLPRHHRAPCSAAASKASAGTLETFPLYEVANLSRYLERTKSKGFWIAGTVVESGTPLHTFDRDRPLILVLGNEGRGLRALVQSTCDVALTIPLRGGGSLNVSAAAAVLLYHLTLPR